MRAPQKIIGNAQRLRRRLTAPEARLWKRLRARTPGQPTFRRQHPMGPYILDFYCAEARLAVEIDGITHDMSDQPQRDILRDAWLRKHGITIVRIPVTDLPRDFDETADAIVRLASEQI